MIGPLVMCSNRICTDAPICRRSELSGTVPNKRAQGWENFIPNMRGAVTVSCQSFLHVPQQIGE